MGELRVMRCAECKELFQLQADALAREAFGRDNWDNHPKDIILCPVCRLKAIQRGVSQLAPL